jgi:hypothetical protein
MFDHHHHLTRLGPESIEVRKHVTEQRAPTDESVRLLKEMEGAAKEKVDQAIRLEGNGFTALVQVSHNHHDGDIVMRCLYKWEGEQREVVYCTSDRPNLGTKKGRVEVMLGLREKLAKDIATAVLSRAFAAVKWE